MLFSVKILYAEDVCTISNAGHTDKCYNDNINNCSGYCNKYNYTYPHLEVSN